MKNLIIFLVLLLMAVSTFSCSPKRIACPVYGKAYKVNHKKLATYHKKVIKNRF